jgi:pyruvate dehydrogenase E2 component (dihydrolipoamide acetyltransferase)
MAELVEMPKLGFDMAEGTLVSWVKSEGDSVQKGEVLAEIETDKATIQVEASAGGVVLRHLVAAGSTVPVGTPIAVIAQPDESVDVDALLVGVKNVQSMGEVQPELPVQSEVQPQQEEPQITLSVTERLKASPLARAMAEKEGIDLRQVHGSGPNGRILKRDVQAYLKRGRKALKEKLVPEVKEMPLGEARELKLSALRQTIGKRMLASKTTIPHFYITRSCDVALLLKMREEVNANLTEEERISVNDFIVKAAALTLREFPNLNASIQQDKITQHSEINIGSAVAVEGGLLSVVCRNADRKSLTAISSEMREMVARVKEGKLRGEDIEGSTFTITNLGMYGVDEFIAIINPPEAAILAVGSAMTTPVVENGLLVVGQRLKATLSVDHRISDGAEAARFMQSLADYLQQPWRLW